MLERRSKLWYTNTIEFYTAMKIDEHCSTAITWINLATGTLSKKRQGQQHIHYLIPFIQSSERLKLDCDGYLSGAAKGVDTKERWLSVGAYDVLFFDLTSVHTKL